MNQKHLQAYYYETFLPRRLAHLRKLRNVSAPKMSIALGQNVNYISLLERGKLLPSMSSFLYICQYLCITPQQFFTLHSKNPKDQQALIELFNQLENDFTDHILALMHIAIEAEKNKSRQYTQMRRGENSHE